MFAQPGTQGLCSGRVVAAVFSHLDTHQSATCSVLRRRVSAVLSCDSTWLIALSSDFIRSLYKRSFHWSVLTFIVYIADYTFCVPFPQ